MFSESTKSNKVADTHRQQSQFTEETGELGNHSFERRESAQSNRRWLYIALVVGGIVGLGLVGVGMTSFFGPQAILPTAWALNSIGTIATATGGALTIGGVVGVVGLVKTRSRKHVSLNQEFVGSNDARLDETGIQRELQRLGAKPGSQNLDVLVIYGDGTVQLNTDPGFVDLNPKKVVLVGARIVHQPGYNRLDDKFGKEWLSSMVRVARKHEECDSATFVTQKIVSSVEEAIQHSPPSRGFGKGKYHLVYQVIPICRNKATRSPNLLCKVFSQLRFG